MGCALAILVSLVGILIGTQVGNQVGGSLGHACGFLGGFLGAILGAIWGGTIDILLAIKRPRPGPPLRPPTVERRHPESPPQAPSP
jgi:hypothetical protein